MPKAKVTKTVKKTTKELGAETLEKLAAKTLDIVAQLDAGEQVHPYTILPTQKVANNHTVIKVQDLNEGRTLCKYKDAEK